MIAESKASHNHATFRLLGPDLKVITKVSTPGTLLWNSSDTLGQRVIYFVILLSILSLKLIFLDIFAVEEK